MNIRPLLLTAVISTFSGSGMAQAQLTVEPSTPSSKAVSPLLSDPKLPPVPVLSAADPMRIQIRVLDTYRGPVYQLEAVEQSKAEILKAIADAMGQQAVIAPTLQKWFPAGRTKVLRALSLEDLLQQEAGVQVRISRSSTGQYLFTDSFAFIFEKLLIAPKNQWRVPFSLVPPQPLQKPNPEWRKHSFNGRDVYEIPLTSPDN